MNTGRILLLYFACWTGAAAADWPQWRGLNRDSVSAESVGAGWPAAGPKVLWSASVGTGFSSVSVSQGRAYTIGNATNQDTVWCFDAVSGTAFSR